MADAQTPSEYRPDALIAEDIDAYLARHRDAGLLRFITCGSVDDGKSTLIGRLLYDSHMVFEDQLQQLESDSARVGTQGETLDFALLVDGLSAEREQGITIDVAYRFFATENRKFIVADTPGHEQYTRNMVTGASTATANANSRGAEKIIYGGYFPMGLSLERIMSDMKLLPLKTEVWPKFLRDNALKVLGLRH